MQCLTQRASSSSAASTSSRGTSTRQLALPSTTLRRSSSSTLLHRQACTSPLFRSRDQLPGRSPVVCQGLFGLGLPEVAVIAGIAAIVFGPSKLPEVGKGLGKTVKSFQTAAKEFEQELKQASKDDDAAAPAEGQPQQQMTSASSQQATPPPSQAASPAQPPPPPPAGEERKKEPSA